MKEVIIISNKILDRIIQAKENIDDDIAIEKVVNYLKLDNYNPASKSASCPFGHSDSTPSFKWDKKQKMFHCFSGETKVITFNGIREMKDLINFPVKILNGNEEWEEVAFKKYGVQDLVRLHLVPLNLFNNGCKEKYIYTTAYHEWILTGSKKKVYTNNLKHGDVIGFSNVNSPIYIVDKVEKTDRHEDVYCCETSTKSFYLEGMVLTGNCFSCGKNFSLLDLYIRTEGSYRRAVEKLCNEAGIPFNSKDLKIEDKSEFFLNYIYPEEVECKNRTVVENYCAKRGISVNTLDYAGIKQDYHGNVVFELRDLDDTLLAIKYRLSRAVKNKDEPKMWWDKKASNCPILYNINRIDTSQPLIIVEGYFDALALIESGNTNVVSIPGGAQDLKWIQFNYEFLENFNTIYLWFDNDKAGQDGLENTINRIGESKIKVIKPTVEDEDEVEKYYKNISNTDISIRKTDANNILLACGAKRISELITFAEEIPCKNLKYLMDCEVVNVMDIPKTSTGIGELDDILYGNLYPCFTIYSGVAGSGKSSLTNTTCVLPAIENNEKIFIFSGELGEGQLLDWIITPCAGLNHILEMENKNINKPFYVVSTEAMSAIKRFYRRNIILYDSTNSLDTSGESILREMETAYRRFGCTVFLIDNLMCISFDGEESESKWDSQKKFITKLMGFTNKYGVNVNLVLHPRKPSQAQQAGTQSFSVYDLHGASEIGNLCHRLLWISRLNDQDKQLRIDVVKDRPSQSAGQHCELYYDKRTRRIYGTEEERTKTYKWEQSSNIIYTQKQKELLLCNRPDDRIITSGIQMAIDDNQM